MKTPPVDIDEIDAADSRRALVSAWVGNTVEWYDFAIYGALATVITPLFFPDNTPTGTLFAGFAVFATAFVARPFGAIFFGRRADARGRRSVLVWLIVAMSLATAAIGALPTYAVVGVAAPLALIVLRATQGFTAGGELGVALAFMVEHSPAGRRGSTTAWQPATLALGVAIGFALTGSLALVLPDDDLGGWWRVAFLLALPMGLVGLYIRRRVTEAPVFAEVSGANAEVIDDAVRTVWRTHRRAVGAGFSLIAAASIAFNMFFVYLPNHLIVDDDRTLPEALFPAVVGLLIASVAAVGFGRLSDRIGRRPVVVTSLVTLAVASTPMLILANAGSSLALVVGESVVGIAIGGAMSVAMIAEMFSTPLRATGIAMTGGLATALLGGTSPLVGQVLAKATGGVAASGVYVAAASVAALIAIWSWPESAFDDLT